MDIGKLMMFLSGVIAILVGWSVNLSDKDATTAVTTKLCESIESKSIVGNVSYKQINKH